MIPTEVEDWTYDLRRALEVLDHTGRGDLRQAFWAWILWGRLYSLDELAELASVSTFTRRRDLALRLVRAQLLVVLEGEAAA